MFQKAPCVRASSGGYHSPNLLEIRCEMKIGNKDYVGSTTERCSHSSSGMVINTSFYKDKKQNRTHSIMRGHGI